MLDEVAQQVVDAPGGVVPDGVGQQLPGDDHVAHAGVLAGLGGAVQGVGGHPAGVVRPHDGVEAGLGILRLQGAEHGDIRAAGDVVFQGGPVVDVAHHIGVGQQDVGRGGDGLQVVQRVAQVIHFAPVVGAGVLGGEGGQDLKPAVFAVQVILLGIVQMLHQGLIVLGGQHAHVGNAGVDHVGQHEIHHAVASAEGDRGHIAVVSKGAELVGVQLGENNTSHVHSGHPPKQFPWV